MRATFGIAAALAITAIVSALAPVPAGARPPIRRAFFNVYTSAEGTRLDDLPSNASHCGVCHYDFGGGGARNAYGAKVEVAIGSAQYATTEEAIQSIENLDSDNDGYTSLVEITNAVFSNTPTFPGLKSGNETLVSNVTVSEITPYLTPMGSEDITPPVVTVLSPGGGQVLGANSVAAITWLCSDASGIASVTIYHSDDGGVTFKPVSFAEPDDGSYDWFIPNRPGSQNIIRVMAKDNAGNYGAAWGAGTFTITALPGLTTFRDMDLPGTQPFALVFESADTNCVTCHGNYNSAVEPWYQWRGSMMAQAMRDPLFLACLAIAEQDAPSVGDLCIRCHTPGGWAEGRSVDTSGGLINAKDREGVQCDFCHRLVDPIYKPGISPLADVAVLDSLTTVPVVPANGQFVLDPDPVKRGPYADAQASHAFLESPFHRADACGTCHDVSNPVFEYDGAPGRLRARHAGCAAPRWRPAQHVPRGAHVQRVVAERLRQRRRVRAAVRRQQAGRHRVHLPGLPHAGRERQGMQRTGRAHAHRPAAARPHRRQHLPAGHHPRPSSRARWTSRNSRPPRHGPRRCCKWRRHSRSPRVRTDPTPR